jgi:hypothetical protein
MPNLNQVTLVAGSEMRDHNECHARIGWQVLKQLHIGFNAACRAADTDDWKG